MGEVVRNKCQDREHHPSPAEYCDYVFECHVFLPEPRRGGRLRDMRDNPPSLPAYHASPPRLRDCDRIFAQTTAGIHAQRINSG